MVSVYFDVSASNGKHYQQWCDVFKVNKKVFQIYSFTFHVKEERNYLRTTQKPSRLWILNQLESNYVTHARVNAANFSTNEKALRWV